MSIIAKNLVSDTIPLVRSSDPGIKVLNMMEIFRVSHLPIVNNKSLLGIISDTDIFDLNDAEQAIGNHELSLNKAFVYENQHVFDVLDTIYRNKLSVLPVVSQKEDYIGVITLRTLLSELSCAYSLQSTGAVFVLKLHSRDYSMSEISQIIESNDAKILSTFIFNSNNFDEIEVNIKLNTINVERILKTFERYGYNVSSFISGTDSDINDMKDKIDELINYLNI